VPAYIRLSGALQGWDPLIVEGAAGMLRDRRIAVLEFEWAPVAWDMAMVRPSGAPLSQRVLHGAAGREVNSTLFETAPGVRLAGLVRRLEDAGYTCFFQGGRRRKARSDLTQQRGSLVNIHSVSGCHWPMRPGRNGNVVCAHAEPIIERLRGLTLKGSHGTG